MQRRRSRLCRRERHSRAANPLLTQSRKDLGPLTLPVVASDVERKSANRLRHGVGRYCWSCWRSAWRARPVQHRRANQNRHPRARRGRRPGPPRHSASSQLWAGGHVVVYRDPQAPPSPMSPQDPCIDAVLTLTWAAAATSTIHLATGIMILPQRDPLVLAKEVASLDVLSGGRLTLGVRRWLPNSQSFASHQHQLQRPRHSHRRLPRRHGGPSGPTASPSATGRSATSPASTPTRDRGPAARSPSSSAAIAPPRTVARRRERSRLVRLRPEARGHRGLDRGTAPKRPSRSDRRGPPR